MSARLLELEARTLDALIGQGVEASRMCVEVAVDMRYEGQDRALTIPLDSADEPCVPSSSSGSRPVTPRSTPGGTATRPPRCRWSS